VPSRARGLPQTVIIQRGFAGPLAPISGDRLALGDVEIDSY